jgi:hypothetical protein
MLEVLHLGVRPRDAQGRPRRVGQAEAAAAALFGRLLRAACGAREMVLDCPSYTRGEVHFLQTKWAQRCARKPRANAAGWTKAERKLARPPKKRTLFVGARGPGQLEELLEVAERGP